MRSVKLPTQELCPCVDDASNFLTQQPAAADDCLRLNIGKSRYCEIELIDRMHGSAYRLYETSS